MDLAQLRTVLRPCIIPFYLEYTHTTLQEFFNELSLQLPVSGRSKQDKVKEAFDSLLDQDLPATARRFLERFPQNASKRNEIHDILWADDQSPEINKRVEEKLPKR